jgi:predicted amidohydrolase
MVKEYLNVSLLQADISHDDIESNFGNYEKLLILVKENSDIIVFPEMFACGFSDDIVQYGEQYYYQSIDFLCKTSQNHHADVIASLPVKADKLLYNRLVWIRGNRIIATYDKRHLFFGCEKQFCTEGKTKIIVSVEGWNLFPLICYDIRFPVWCRNKYENETMLYDCLLLTANFPSPRAETLKSLLIARAIENQSYVIGLNRVGKDGYDNFHSGNSMVINPLGEIIAEAPFNEQFVLNAKIEWDLLNKLRTYFPVYEDWD